MSLNVTSNIGVIGYNNNISENAESFVAIAWISNYFAYSTDGITWTEGTISGTSRLWYSVCYGNGKFVAAAGGQFGASSIYYYSTDGINWSISNLKSSKKSWMSSCYGNDKFIIVSLEGACTYLTNDDFVETVELLHPTTDDIDYWNDKAEKGHTHILDNRVKVDASDVIGNITIDQIPEEAKERMITVNSISDMLKLTKNDAHEGTWVFVTETNASKLFVVKSLTTWTESTSPSNRLWDSLCYGNDKYVAIAYNSNYFAYSTDGIHWTQGSIGYTRYWMSVCYGNGKFVAIAKNTNYYAYSSNGTSWTRGTLPSSRLWYFVCYGNGKFVTVANNSNYFAYGNPCISLDNFTQLTISPNITWDDLANKPTTFDELGITDSISNTEVDTLVSNLSTPAASAQTAVDTTSEKYSILTDDLIANTHKIDTALDDSDQKLNALYDILTMPDEIVTTLKSLMT